MVLVVDGFESLTRWSRLRLSQQCRRHDWGLLTTAHSPLALPRLISLTPNVENVLDVVERLQCNGPRLVREQDVRQAFQRSGRNARETLFALYDLYEVRQRAARTSANRLSGC